MVIFGIDSIEHLNADGASGIDVRSRRGPIGVGLWARRWMEFLDSACDPTELENGRRLARKSQVYQLTIDSCRLAGIVAEIRQEPFFPTLDIPPIDSRYATAIRDWVSQNAEVTSQLFAGILPPEILDIISENDMAPNSGVGGCTCDWDSGPCRHEVALQCIFAEYLDLRPWALLDLMGIPYLELCNHIRQIWGVPTVEREELVSEQKIDVDSDFYGNASSIPRNTALEELSKLDVLDRLGPPPFFPAGERNVKQTLTKLYDD